MIIEIDPETGNVLRSINVNDLFDKTYVTRSDWAHINAFAYIPEEDCVIVSMRNIHTIAKISLKSNELIWIIANPEFYKKTEQKDKVLKPDGHIDWFFQQHAVSILECDSTAHTYKIILFDNHTANRRPVKYFDKVEKSNVLILNIDEKSGKVSQEKRIPTSLSITRSNAFVTDKGDYIFAMCGNLKEQIDGYRAKIYKYDYKSGECVNEILCKKDFFSEDIKIDAIELMRYIDTLDGYNFEKVCAYILCCNGYINICVTSGSKYRGIDIIAEKDGMKYAVQCKHYSSNVGNHAVQEAFSGKSIYNADVAVVLTNSYFTQQAEQDARTLCVELWNRSKLLNMIENIGYTSEVTEKSYGEEISNDCLKLFCENILEAFRQFQVYLMIQNVYVGDVYIKYGFALEKGIRIKKVLSLQNDISLNLGVAIQIDVNYEKSNIEIIIPRKFLYERYMR